MPVGPSEGLARRVPTRVTQSPTGPTGLAVTYTVLSASEVVLEEGSFGVNQRVVVALNPSYFNSTKRRPLFL